MPRLSIWFIRAALIYLAVGFTFGALLLANKGFPISPQLWRLLPAHIELLLVGWTLQLAMGVAFWILPRIRATRGVVRPAWAAFALLNGGLLAGGAGWGSRRARLGRADRPAGRAGGGGGLRGACVAAGEGGGGVRDKACGAALNAQAVSELV